MAALKWQRIADSDGTTVMYTAVAGQPEPRRPYHSYRIYPVGSLHNANRVIGYAVEHRQGERLLERIGSVPWRYGHGEYKLADAKRAAQDHHNTTHV